jgi:hypothetical protein
MKSNIVVYISSFNNKKKILTFYRILKNEQKKKLTKTKVYRQILFIINIKNQYIKQFYLKKKKKIVIKHLVLKKSCLF